MATIQDVKLFAMGNNQQMQWNKKLCFEARDSLYDCVDQQPNGNKLRCPDQLYAYEMWCPTEFRRIHTAERSKKQLDEQMYDAKWVAGVNYAKQTLSEGNVNPYL